MASEHSKNRTMAEWEARRLKDQEERRNHRRKLHYLAMGYVLVGDANSPWWIVKLDGATTMKYGPEDYRGWLSGVVLFGPATYQECIEQLDGKCVHLPKELHPTREEFQKGL